jgi:hypothetical protein
MSLLDIIEYSNGTHVSLSTILRSSSILLQSKKKKTLDSTELRISILIYFTGERQTNALSYGNQNVLYKCLDKMDQTIKKRFISVLYSFGIEKCSNRAVYYITGIYHLENYVICNDIIYYNTLSINTFLNSIVNMFYYFKDKKIDITLYELLFKIISNDNPIEIIWDADKTINNLNEKMKKYYVNFEFTNKFLEKIF